MTTGNIVEAHKRLYGKHSANASATQKEFARSILQAAKDMGRRIRLSKRGRTSFGMLGLARKKRSDAGKKRGKRTKKAAAAAATAAAVLPVLAAAASVRRSGRARKQARR